MNAFPVQKINLYTEEEFFAWCEEHPDEKFEFVNGEIVAMAGATINHNRISRNFNNKFSAHLEHSKCEVFFSDIFVKCSANMGNKLYLPDIVVNCDDDVNGNDKIAHSPVLIVEVVSKSTRHIDFLEKLNAYQKIPSLQEYVVVEQETKQVHISRKSNHWQGQSYTEGNIYFESIGYSMTIEEIYQRVVFEK